MKYTLKRAKKPLVSVLTPTYNSASTLKMTLDSIKKQTYPQDLIEILIVDGGSIDETLKIAKKYKCRILKNTKVGILEGEYLGFFKAKGTYLLGMPPDEVLESSESLKLKLKVFQSNKKVKCVLPSGYKTPEDYAKINHYVNEFGDPFSFFMYRDSKGHPYLASDLAKKYKIFKRTRDYTIFSFSDNEELPLIEPWAGGSIIDLEYAKANFPEIKKEPGLIPLVFYLFNRNKMLLGVTNNDPTIHYSSGNLRKYLKKIRSRVEFNIFKTSMGMGGYSGREKFETRYSKLKKYLFFIYSFSIIPAVLDALYLTVSRRQLVFLLHPLLCIYTATLIMYFYIIKTFNINHNIKLYGH